MTLQWSDRRLRDQGYPMILGQVNARNEAVIPVKAYDIHGQLVELEATVDTGFSGYLTLPAANIARLQLLYDR